MNNIPGLKKRILLIIIAVILLIAAVTAFTGISRARKYYPVPLMYHLIMDEPYSQYEYLFVRPADFDAQLTAIEEAGYGFCFADDFSPKDDKNVILTFDDAYEDNYTLMFPILKEHNAKATVFIITDFIGTDGYMTWEQVNEMSESGLVLFGSHTQSHRKLMELNSKEKEQELKESAKIVEERIGKSCRTISYPEGSYDNDTKEICGRYYDFAYTSDKARYGMVDKHSIPRLCVVRDVDITKLMKSIERWSRRMAE